MKKSKRLLAGYLIVMAFSLMNIACKESENRIDDGEITQFTVWDQNSIKHELHVNNVKNIISNKETFPINVNLSRLVAEFKTNHANVVLKVNGELQQSGKTRNDFTKEIIYDLFVGETKQRSYAVNITKGVMTNSFRAFSFPEKEMENYQPIINEETGEISNENEIPKNINISDLAPAFTLTERGATVKVNGVKQVSGVQRHDFSKPIVYTIEGEDGSSRSYTVDLKQGDFVAIKNPVMSGSYADPTVIHVGNEFYTYVTSGRVRGYRSSDLFNWRSIGPPSEVFTTRPDFVEVVSGKDAPGMWAPDINYFDGKYVMYYSISQWGEGAKCGIGVGVSNLPQGPFVPPAGNPNGKLFISTEIGVHNSIDPCFYEENDKRYLFWGSFHGLYMTELTADGMAVKDMAQKTKVGGKAFEATYIHKRGNYYYLFTSVGGCCDGVNSSYKVVVGRSQNLAGPYMSRGGVDMNTVDAWGATGFDPIVLQGNDTYIGPGHNARIITDKNGVDWMLYHSYIKENNTVGSRNLMLGKVNWDNDGWPIVDNGTPSPVLTEIPVF
ncbi:MAG TPA: family 43 glycosylhydrolase [Sphingobacterium sp.]|nr:family 43 glycosylhydrolase [Sphingobacterium sp.]